MPYIQQMVCHVFPVTFACWSFTHTRTPTPPYMHTYVRVIFQLENVTYASRLRKVPRRLDLAKIFISHSCVTTVFPSATSATRPTKNPANAGLIALNRLRIEAGGGFRLMTLQAYHRFSQGKSKYFTVYTT